jgi:hypothetical protein
MRRGHDLLLFKGIHRDRWHYDESFKTPGDIKEFHAACGAYFSHMFAEWQYVAEKESALPDNTCARCYRYITGKEKK